MKSTGKTVVPVMKEAFSALLLLSMKYPRAVDFLECMRMLQMVDLLIAIEEE